MVDPTTTNILLSVPLRGSDAGTWDLPVNGNSSALDGYFGGVQPVSLTNIPVTLTAPTGSPTPAPGPTQAQNAVLRFTGALSANVVVTLPLPGYYIVENLTTGNFTVTFRGVTATQVIAVEQGACQHIYNDGANVRFVNMARVGGIEIWAGYSAIPAWVSACTVPPYLLCDGSIYSFTTYPYLGARFGSAFGGNGTTTFGVPDLRGRMALPYDGTGTRITTAGCGINGQTIGDAQDKQTNTLITANTPPYTPAGTITNGAITISYTGTIANAGAVSGNNNGGGGGAFGVVQGSVTPTASQAASTFTGTPQGGTSAPVNNVQPSLVTGIAVIRAA